MTSSLEWNTLGEGNDKTICSYHNRKYQIKYHKSLRCAQKIATLSFGTYLNSPIPISRCTINIHES
jgi:hypothetical protein